MLNLLETIDAGELSANISLVLANRDCAGIERISERGVPVELVASKSFSTPQAHSAALFARLRAAQVDLVLLAGYLARLVIPPDFEQRVLNIHPALIPAFSGHGMYGEHVHRAVIARGCKVSGCTVHFCDHEYDHGPILVQRVVPVLPDDTPSTLAARVFEAECIAYPEALRLLISGEASRYSDDRNDKPAAR